MQTEAEELLHRVQALLPLPPGEGWGEGDNVVAKFTVRPALSEIGGGSLATESLESRVVAIQPKTMHVDELARRMRLNRPPVFGRVEKGEYLLDFRTLRRDEIPIIVTALLSAFQR
jgi:seryl-tRNA(Sec) selenium transferase